MTVAKLEQNITLLICFQRFIIFIRHPFEAAKLKYEQQHIFASKAIVHFILLKSQAYRPVQFLKDLIWYICHINPETIIKISMSLK